MKSEKHKIIFNLSIKDLKELGLIKKRRKRRKNNYKYLNKKTSINNKLFDELKTTNLSKGDTIIDKTNELKNELLEMEFKRKKEELNNPQLLQIKDNLESEKIRNDFLHNENRSVMNYMYNEIKNRFDDIPEHPKSSIYNTSNDRKIDSNNYVSDIDNIDTSTTYGSDNFINSNIGPNETLPDLHSKRLNDIDDDDDDFIDDNDDDDYIDAVDNSTPISDKIKISDNQFFEEFDNLIKQTSNEIDNVINTPKQSNIKIGGPTVNELLEEQKQNLLPIAEKQQEDTNSLFNKNLNEIILTERRQNNLNLKIDEYLTTNLQKGEKPLQYFLKNKDIREITKEIKRLKKLKNKSK